MSEVPSFPEDEHIEVGAPGLQHAVRRTEDCVRRDFKDLEASLVSELRFEGCRMQHHTRSAESRANGVVGHIAVVNICSKGMSHGQQSEMRWHNSREH